MAIAVAVALFAACIPADASMAACCEAMHHACGPEGEPQACCSAQSPQIGALTAATHIPDALDAAVMVAIPVDLRLTLEDSPDARHHLLPVKPPGVPRYLLAGTFRI